MRAHDLMKHNVCFCGTEATLSDVAKMMWERDVGAIPVVDQDKRPIGMITDRDVCMAAMLNGVPLRARGVMTAMSSQVVTCFADTPLAEVEKMMRDAQVRRVPVVDSKRTLIGIIALADLAHHSDAQPLPTSAPGVAKTLSAITERRWLGSLAVAAA